MGPTLNTSVYKKICTNIIYLCLIILLVNDICIHIVHTLIFGVRLMHVKRVMHGISFIPNVNVCTICVQITHLYIFFFLYIKKKKKIERYSSRMSLTTGIQ
jgi:hypothetical protein